MTQSSGYSWYNPLSWFSSGNNGVQPAIPMQDYSVPTPMAGLGNINPMANLMLGQWNERAPSLGAAAPQSGMPGMNGMNTGLGPNIGTGQLALSGLGALGNLWTGMQAQDMAKKQFGLASTVANANLANQIRSYNNALEDRVRSRMVAENRNPDEAESYLATRRMSR
jgi:hypothetical protein